MDSYEQVYKHHTPVWFGHELLGYWVTDEQGYCQYWSLQWW